MRYDLQCRLRGAQARAQTQTTLSPSLIRVLFQARHGSREPVCTLGAKFQGAAGPWLEWKPPETVETTGDGGTTTSEVEGTAFRHPEKGQSWRKGPEGEERDCLTQQVFN